MTGSHSEERVGKRTSDVVERRQTSAADCHRSIFRWNFFVCCQRSRRRRGGGSCQHLSRATKSAIILQLLLTFRNNSFQMFFSVNFSICISAVISWYVWRDRLLSDFLRLFLRNRDRFSLRCYFSICSWYFPGCVRLSASLVTFPVVMEHVELIEVETIVPESFARTNFAPMEELDSSGALGAENCTESNTRVT